jgi:DUF438 domain-containing protein
MDDGTLHFILNCWNKPLVFVDTDHVIRYMNRPAKRHYAKWGDVIGRSIFECHSERSCEIIKSAFGEIREGKREILISDSTKHRVYMRGVRDEEGKLVGYCERYDPPRKSRGE